MMLNGTTIIYILNGLFVLLVVLLGTLGIIILKKYLNENKQTSQEVDTSKKSSDSKKGNDVKKYTARQKQYTINSLDSFMEFEKIENNLIVQKNGKKYIMVIECKGINFDLMSEEEKLSVEGGFVQFLNTLNGSIQLYVQTRKVNLKESIDNYKEKMVGLESNYSRQRSKYEILSRNPKISKAELKKEYMELVKLKNLYEYGKDVVYNTERMSLNKNILNKKYFLVISYYATGNTIENLDKSEIAEIAFSDLYVKAQTLIRALAPTGVEGKILSSADLVELLYVAYNRDESEIFDSEKVLQAHYNSLYTSAPDYMEKKLQLLDKEINKKAYEKANSAILNARSNMEKLYDDKVAAMEDLINDLAESIIMENQEVVGTDIANSAVSSLRDGEGE